MDFVEATLQVTGTGYQGQTHDYNLTLKNVPSNPDYILLSCNYTVNFEVGLDREALITGVYNTPMLYVGDSVSYTGTFSPSLYGSGNITMDVTDIQWGLDEAITWSTRVDTWVSLMGKIAAVGPIVTGADRTYVGGSASFTLTAVDSSAIVVSFEVYIEKDGSKIQTIHSETDFTLTKDVAVDFEYSFTSTEGGDLTMVLDITDWHAS